MKAKEILTIIAISALALCFILSLDSRLTKNIKTKEVMTHACSLLVFIGIALLATTQLLSDKEDMRTGSAGQVQIQKLKQEVVYAQGTPPAEADILVVGAGMSGLYAAWRIKKENPSKTIIIIDRLNRTGGRLQTDIINIPTSHQSGVTKDSTIVEEEGGMRLDSAMYELNALLSALKLTSQLKKFPMQPVKGPNNSRYLIEGKSFTQEYATKNPIIWSSLYHLEPSELKKQPENIFAEIYKSLLHHNTAKIYTYFKNTKDANDVISQSARLSELQTPGYWQFVRLNFTWPSTDRSSQKPSEIPLNRWTLPPLLNAMGYSQGCIQMLGHTMGFEQCIYGKVNAGQAMWNLLDIPTGGKNAGFMTFKDGFSVVPNTLVNEINLLTSGQSIFLKRNCDHIRKDKTGLRNFSVGISRSNDPEVRVAYPFSANEETIKVDKIILTVGKNALEHIFYASDYMNQSRVAPQFLKNMKSSENVPLMKINLYFATDWWNDGLPSRLYGPNISSTSIGAVYPFYSRHMNHPAPAALTCYSDYSHIDYWLGLQGVGKLFTSPLQELHSKQKPQTLFPATNSTVDEVIRHLKKLFNKTHIPTPLMTSIRIWNGTLEFPVATHSWGLGADDKTIIEQMVSPFHNIYIANETYSDQQTWVNGSLRSTDLVLAKGFGISKLSSKETKSV